MRPPWWKKILSYVVEFHIENAPSEYNPDLHVCLNDGRYQLCTENAIYSYGDLYNNFSNAFSKINLDQPPIEEVLILGFGLGSIPIILEKMGKNYKYTAIEIDEEVIYLASKYELPYLRSPVDLVCADALIWLESTTAKFDLIAVDLFLDDTIPARFEAISFLEQLKNRLTDHGVILYNRLAYTEIDLEKSTAFFESTFLPVFPNAIALDVSGNLMLVSDKGCIKNKVYL